ncbi:TSUP family transporter [Actinomadura algeriensis]|uniref:Probable membrane transporter protein n=1 Tax=Actinomadura algeriensis TaxID=1679523 RepID=A0ABR9JLD6_9ACTN|nr:sulfite exporter TauE/SafE family protein [Actinomadura algeriensis]MBE1530925.1 putative membrane protein YfcA [Actinomadura algeriensis]
MVTVLALGAVIGVLLGLLGGGGSILAVPALVYGAGLPPAAAIPASLLVVGISSATAALPRLRDVRWRIAGVVGGAGAVAAVGGAALGRLLPDQAIMLGFAALMVVAGARMLTGDVPSGGACALPGGGVDWRSCLPRSLAAGTAVGVLTGLFGVGGGFLVVPALVLGLGLSMAAAVGTSLVIVAANAAAGFAVHAGGAALDPAILGGFTAAAVAGSLAAARHANTDRLRRWFAVLVFAIAALTAAQTLLNPPS